MKKIYSFILTIVSMVFLVACGGDDDDSGSGVVDACGDSTDETVNDKRCLYKVSTLTEEFNGSGGLTVDSDGFIYVADFGNQINNADGTTVSKIDPNTGEVSLFADGLDGPSGNTFAADGNLIQANIQGSSISVITPSGEVSELSNARVQNPVGVVFDEIGNLYVCNCGASSIQRIEPDGSSLRFFSSGALLNCPNGLTIDNEDNLYVANFGNGNVIKVTPDRKGSILTTLPGRNNAHIVFGNGVLYVLGRGANQLFEVTLDGEVSVIAGTGEDGNEDGSGEDSSFFIPNGIGISNDGSKIYVVSRLVDVGSPLNPVVVRVVELK